MKLIKQNYPLLNGQTPVFSRGISEHAKCRISKMLENILIITPQIFHPANNLRKIIMNWHFECAQNAYQLSVGNYCVIFDENSYCIVDCYIEDNVKSIQGIDCNGNKVFGYKLYDEISESVSDEVPPLSTLAVSHLLFYKNVALKTLQLTPPQTSGRLFGYKYESDFAVSVMDINEYHQNA